MTECRHCGDEMPLVNRSTLTDHWDQLCDECWQSLLVDFDREYLQENQCPTN